MLVQVRCSLITGGVEVFRGWNEDVPPAEKELSIRWKVPPLKGGFSPLLGKSTSLSVA